VWGLSRLRLKVIATGTSRDAVVGET